MSRIGSSISGLDQYFLSHLNDLDNDALRSAIRLTTGKQVPKPSYDPAAFVLISGFEAHLNVLESTKTQVDLAANLGSESQLALDETRNNLLDIRNSLLFDDDLSLSNEERNVEQAFIDAAVQSIRSISRTEINGRRVLDGSSNYTVSGRDTTQIKSVQVFSASESTFSGTVHRQATQAVESIDGASGNVNTGDATFTLAGKRGITTISVTDGEALTDVSERINLDSHITGVIAEVSGDTLSLLAVDKGDRGIVEIDVTSGAFATTTQSTGQDADVTINGKRISGSDIDGNRVTYTSHGTNIVFEFEGELQGGFEGDFNTVTITDERVQKFALTADTSKRDNFAIQGIQPELLGGPSGSLMDLVSGGSLDGLGTNASAGLRIVDEALAQLTVLQGQVDAFADITVESSSTLLESLTTETNNVLEDLNAVDEDAESLKLAKSQTLASSTLSSLALVQQQRFSALGLLQLIAGI